MEYSILIIIASGTLGECERSLGKTTYSYTVSQGCGGDSNIGAECMQGLKYI